MIWEWIVYYLSFAAKPHIEPHPYSFEPFLGLLVSTVHQKVIHTQFHLDAAHNLVYLYALVIPLTVLSSSNLKYQTHNINIMLSNEIYI